MLFPLKRIIDESRISKKDGLCIIYIQYCYSSAKRTLLNTEIRIPPAFWDDKKGYVKKNLPEQYGRFAEFNEALGRMFLAAGKIVQFINEYQVTNPTVFAKELFKPDFDPASLEDYKPVNIEKAAGLNTAVYYQIDNYIKSRMPHVTAGMFNVYKNMKDHLQGFEAYRRTLPDYKNFTLTFESFDYNFYEGFVHFLANVWTNQKCSKSKIVGLKVNTIGKTIKQLRTFLRDRIRRKIIESIDLNAWKILEEEVDAIYLPEKDIEKIIRADLSNSPHLEDYREEIIVGCRTGLRYSDFSTIDRYDLRDHMIFIKQRKSRHWVVIPLLTDVEEILKRRFARNFMPNTNQEFNRHGRTILKLAGVCDLIKHSYKKGNIMVVEVKPKYDWFSSHTCRRSFCTNEFLAGTPVALIMKISGHKSEKDFFKYIRISPEESARILLQIWIDRAKARGQNNLTNLNLVA